MAGTVGSEVRVERVPDWPPLAWLAVCPNDGGPVTCFVGSGVEADDHGVSEAVWAGPFEEGDFDLTDLVSGSGARRREGTVVFVSSGTMLDRLHSWEGGDGAFVSNSLPCLLSAIGGQFDLAVRRYRGIFASILEGIDDYERRVPTTAGPVTVTVHRNLVWDGRTLTTVDKPSPQRDFSSYERYRSFLTDTMRDVLANAGSGARAQPFDPITTISRGYDSTAISALASEYGSREAFGFDRARNGVDDSGADAAAMLGLRYRSVPTDRWKDTDADALVPFLAAVTGAGSSASYRAAEDLVRGRLVLTGYHGDRMWGRGGEPMGTDLKRQDLSGGDLTEYRLRAGFVNCTVPFWGARQVDDVRALAERDELVPWRVASSYDRPIPRRIAEDAGLPRELVGRRKLATAQVLFGRADAMTPELRERYYGWLDDRRDHWASRGDRAPAAPNLVERGAAWTLARVRRLREHRRVEGVPTLVRLLDRVDRVLAGATDPTRFQYVYHWATTVAQERYPRPAGLPAATRTGAAPQPSGSAREP